MTREFDNHEKCMLQADSQMKRAKSFLLFTQDDAGGNFIFSLDGKSMMEAIGIFAYAKEKCEREIWRLSGGCGEDD